MSDCCRCLHDKNYHVNCKANVGKRATHNAAVCFTSDANVANVMCTFDSLAIAYVTPDQTCPSDLLFTVFFYQSALGHLSHPISAT